MNCLVSYPETSESSDEDSVDNNVITSDGNQKIPYQPNIQNSNKNECFQHDQINKDSFCQDLDLTKNIKTQSDGSTISHLQSEMEEDLDVRDSYHRNYSLHFNNIDSLPHKITEFRINATNTYKIKESKNIQHNQKSCHRSFQTLETTCILKAGGDASNKNLTEDFQSSNREVAQPVAERSAPGGVQGVYRTSRKRKLCASNEDGTLHLPTTIKSMFKESQHIPEDNPALHQNRVRSFPHEQGNWATHVYIPVSREDRLVKFAFDLMETLLPARFEMMPEFHVSLSRTVVIRHHWIEPLVDSLREELRKIPTCVCELVDLKLYTNDEKTRTFVCLELSEDDTELLNYMRAVDKCFKEFRLAPYYENPSFHISIGWCLGNVVQQIPSENITQAKDMLTKFTAAHPDLSLVYADQIYCRSGNKSFVLPLKDSLSRRGL